MKASWLLILEGRLTVIKCAYCKGSSDERDDSEKGSAAARDVSVFGCVVVSCDDEADDALAWRRGKRDKRTAFPASWSSFLRALSPLSILLL